MGSQQSRLRGRVEAALDAKADPRLAAKLRADSMAYSDPTQDATATMSDDELHEYLGQLEAIFEGSLSSVVSEVEGDFEETTETTAGVTLYVTRPKRGLLGLDETLPCVLHIHGGGMAVMSAATPCYVTWRRLLAAKGLVVVGVEFRNSSGKHGRHPYPAGLEDCYAGLQWVHDNKRRLGASVIVVSGESGGGNLTLATCLKAKGSGLIDGAFAMCPYIYGDYHNARADLPSLTDNDGIFQSRLGQLGFARAYNGDVADPLAWPLAASVEDLAGLPPLVISLNELDILRDEGLLFYRNCLKAGVKAQARVVAGTSHAMDLWTAIVPDIADATVSAIHSFAVYLHKQQQQQKHA